MTVLERRGYLTDPAAIYRRSFETIRAEADLSALPRELVPVAIRLIHACGMTDLARDLVWDGGVTEAARDALATGAPIFVDSSMVAAGIIRSRLPTANAVRCTLDDPKTAAIAERRGTTRSAAAVERWRGGLGGAVVAIGNAPTALFRLIEGIEGEAWPAPAAILAFPVGFVGAAESKAALARAELGVPFLTLFGRRGGSALAAAAVNALAGADVG